MPCRGLTEAFYTPYKAPNGTYVPLLYTHGVDSPYCYHPLVGPIIAVQFKATSPDLILHGGLYREEYQNGFKLGIEIILK